MTYNVRVLSSRNVLLKSQSHANGSEVCDRITALVMKTRSAVG